jgi:hypothetical protein
MEVTLCNVAVGLRCECTKLYFGLLFDFDLGVYSAEGQSVVVVV